MGRHQIAQWPLGAKSAAALAVAALIAGGCATVPTGPSVMALPGGGKTFEEFQTDDGVCKQWAHQQTGATPGDSAVKDTVGGSIIGTVLGAAAGAALGSISGHAGTGAAVGAGVGLLGGTAVGASSGQRTALTVQQRYDAAYQQCMYAKGNQIPGQARVSPRATRSYARPPASAPTPPPPPPPPPSSSSVMPPPPPPPPNSSVMTPPPPPAGTPTYTSPPPRYESSGPAPAPAMESAESSTPKLNDLPPPPPPPPSK